jgi:hypothetical protein
MDGQELLRELEQVQQEYRPRFPTSRGPAKDVPGRSQPPSSWRNTLMLGDTTAGFQQLSNVAPKIKRAPDEPGASLGGSST